MSKKRSKKRGATTCTTYTYNAKLSTKQAKGIFLCFGPFWFLEFTSKNGTHCMTPIMYNTEAEARSRAKRTEKALGLKVRVFEGFIRESSRFKLKWIKPKKKRR